MKELNLIPRLIRLLRWSKGEFSLKNLIDKLKLPIKKVAIELNREIVNKKRISKIILKTGDKIEIVNFIGGG